MKSDNAMIPFRESNVFQDENAELRADVKFLMDQNTKLIENMANKPMSGNYQQPKESTLSTTNGQRVLIPEVSNLITSVNQLTSQNFELLKMAKEPGYDIGLYQIVFFRIKTQKLYLILIRF